MAWRPFKWMPNKRLALFLPLISSVCWISVSFTVVLTKANGVMTVWLLCCVFYISDVFKVKCLTWRNMHTKWLELKVSGVSCHFLKACHLREMWQLIWRTWLNCSPIQDRLFVKRSLPRQAGLLLFLFFLAYPAQTYLVVYRPYSRKPHEIWLIQTQTKPHSYVVWNQTAVLGSWKCVCFNLNGQIFFFVVFPDIKCTLLSA